MRVNLRLRDVVRERATYALRGAHVGVINSQARIAEGCSGCTGSSSRAEVKQNTSCVGCKVETGRFDGHHGLESGCKINTWRMNAKLSQNSMIESWIGFASE